MPDKSEGSAGGPSNPPKAISSLAKKQSDVTRMGTQKLKFVPTLPSRRKKEDAKEKEESALLASTSADRSRPRSGEDRGRGRGRADASGRGVAPPHPPQVEMTASGPFALGPAMMGASGTRRTAPRSDIVPVVTRSALRDSLGAGLTNTTAPGVGVKRETNNLDVPKREPMSVDDEGEVYSDPDEGVEIVDMENVRGMDWMAPEGLRKNRPRAKAKLDMKGKAAAEPKIAGPNSAHVDDIDIEHAEEFGETKLNLANALNLSDSEEEEELEDIIRDFAYQLNADSEAGIGHDSLYFFQFPNPFPEFVSSSSVAAKGEGKARETGVEGSDSKKVSFAPPVKPEAPASASGTSGPETGQVSDSEKTVEVEGIIGQLEVYESGVVKMRLANGITLEVNGSTQPSFLQHAAYIDTDRKQICVLGEVDRRFVVSPDVDTLLETLEKAAQDQAAISSRDLDGLIAMDAT